MPKAKTAVLATPDNSAPAKAVEFEGANVTVNAGPGDGIVAMAAAQRNAFNEAATRAVTATYEADEPPTSRSIEDQSESVFAFADSLDIGSATFRALYGELLNNTQFTAFLQASIHTMKPQDAFEALLMAQMSAVHAAMMNMTGRLSKAEYLEQSKFYESAINRLARTYATQLEALRKHRGKGTQTVRHVHVNEGGQALVAETVNHVARGG